MKGDILSPIYVFCSFSVGEESTPIKSIVGIYWHNQKLTHNKSKIEEWILAVEPAPQKRDLVVTLIEIIE